MKIVVHNHEQSHVAAGWIWDCTKEEFFDGWIEFENGRIVAMGRGSIPPATPLFRGIILPRFINHHTHLGDSIFAETVRATVRTMDLRAVVAPPDGLKHRLLASAGKEEIVKGIVQSLQKMIYNGTGRFIDFREEGIQGIYCMHEALRTPLADAGITLSLPSGENAHNGRETLYGDFTFQDMIFSFIFGRPTSLTFTPSEIERILAAVDGIGLSAYADWEHGDFFAIAEEAHRRNKLFAVHVSEEFHEPLDEILDAHPDMLVHMIHSTRKEWDVVAESGIPVVCCPQANALFDLRPPIEGMFQAGVNVMLGTDNAMLIDPDILEEVRYTFYHYPLFRKQGKSGFRKCLRMALPSTGKKLVSLEPIEEGREAHFQVMTLPGRNDYSHPEHILAGSSDGGTGTTSESITIKPVVHGLVRENRIFEIL